MKKILVVDDEQDICQLVQKTLERTGLYNVISTTLPESVVELCKSEKPDLIVLDIVMPNMNGREIIKELRNDEAIIDIMIVVTSGLGEMIYVDKKQEWRWLPNRPIVKERGDVIKEKSAARAADAYGVDDYIAKPFLPQTMCNVLEDVFERQERRSKE